MNILYLAHRIPYPPNKGDKLRAFRQIEHLAKQHRVWCACFVDDPRDWPHANALRDHCEQVMAISLPRRPAFLRGVRGLLVGGTLTAGFYHSKRLRRRLQGWCHDVAFDAVVAFSSSMGPFALELPITRRVLDMCDRDSLKWSDYARRSRGVMRLIYGVEAQRLDAKEREWIDKFDATILITEEEAATLSTQLEKHGHTVLPCPSARSDTVHIVGNGVVILPDPAPDLVDRSFIGDGLIVGFVGVMDYRPNVDGVCWFAREVWPMIRRACPRARFRIVGRNPTHSVNHLEELDGIEVIGEVEDVQRELTRFTVSVAPLHIARGLQNKVLEAMAASKPVVMTSIAACGIAGVVNEHYVIADDAGRFADQVISLLNDAQRCKRIGVAARQFVEQNHRWDAELAKFEAIVTGVGQSKCAREEKRTQCLPSTCDNRPAKQEDLETQDLVAVP